MSSNTTYYVDINSQYRDLEKYPNPADFAVSFATNNQTGYFPQGLPISPSGYFQQASIDPDFIDANLKFENFFILQYQRVGNSIFIAGQYDIFSSYYVTPAAIKYNQYTIFEFYNPGNVPVTNEYQFINCLVRIDIEDRIGLPYPYFVRWNIFTNPTTLYYSQFGYTQFTITNDNNIYLLTSYANPFNLSIQINGSFEILNLIENILPPYGSDTPNYTNSVYIFLLDFDGNLGLYNGHNWGYHSVSSELNSTTVFSEGVLDSGKNLYFSVKPFCESYSYCDGGLKIPYGNDTIYPRNIYLYTGVPDYSLEFIHGWYEYDDDNVKVNPTLSTGVYYILSTSFTGTSLLNLQEINSPSNFTQIGYSDFVEANNNVYSVKNYFTSYTGDANSPATGGVINPDLPIQYYIYDKTGFQFNYLIETSPGSYNGHMYPQSVVYNNNIYTFGRASFTGTEVDSVLYAYKFNTTTNTVLKVSTIGFTGANFTNSKIYAVSELNYIYIMCSDYDVFNSSNDNIVKGFVVRFDPTTNTMIQYSEYEVLAATIAYQNILEKGGQKYLITTYLSNPEIDFYNITDYSNIISAEYFIKGITNLVPVPYKRTVNGIDSYFLFASSVPSFLASLYNISSLENITLGQDFTQASPIYYVKDDISYTYTIALYGYGYFYSNSFTIPPFWYGMYIYNYRQFSDASIQSIHYDINTSKTQTVPPNSNFLANFTFKEKKYITVLSQDYIQFYHIDDTLSLNMEYQDLIGSVNPKTVLKTFTFDNKQWFFICITNTCLVYTINLNFPFLNFTFLEIVSAPWNIVDVQVIDKEGVLSLVLFNNSCDINIYQYTTSFNYISTFNFTNGIYDTYGCSYIFFNNLLTYGYGLFVVVNTNPVTNSSRYIYLDINDLTSITEILDFINGNGGGQSYKSCAGAFINSFVLVLNYFSNETLVSGITASELKFSPFYSTLFPIGFIGGVGEFNGTPCISITSASNVNYFVCNRSNPGSSTEYLACYKINNLSAGAVGAENVFYYTVELPDKCVDLNTVIVGNKTVSVSLLNNNTLYVYDISDPEFAGQNQNLSKTVKTYQNDDFISFSSDNESPSSYLHKINTNGSPDWATYIGGTSSSLENLGFYISTRRIEIDSSQQNIYLAGRFTTRYQVYNYTSTGYYKSQQITYNTYNRENQNGYINKFNINNGNSIYTLPFIGSERSFIRDISYMSNDNSIVFCGDFNSDFITIYNAQLAGTFINPINIQKNLIKIQEDSSFVGKINSNGVIQWTDLLYTDDSGKSVYAMSIKSDSNKIAVIGYSDTDTMRCVDSAGTFSQILYSNIGSTNYVPIYMFTFNSNGIYQQSNLIVAQQYASVYYNFNQVYLEKTNNEIILILNNIFTNSDNAVYNYYNKDGTYGGSKTFAESTNVDSVSFIKYKYDSSYYAENGIPYSQVVFTENTPYTFTGSYFENYYMYIGGSSTSTGINKSFSIRDNFTGPYNKPSIILNTNINIASLDRTFETINDIPNSDQYYFTNVSKSPLTSMIKYDNVNIFTGTNVISVLSSLSPINVNEFYYIVYPYDGGISNKIIPVTNIRNLGSGRYQFTLQYTDDLQSPTGGAYYGPWVYLASFNKSLYYNLQFFPGSIAQPVYFTVKLQSMTVPNRPLLNLNEYGGNMNFNDLPFIYLSLYNVDDENNYDDQIVNVVYDSTPLNVEPYPIFQIPVTNPGTLNNFVTLSSDIQPVVKFSPGFYNLRVRLLDMNGNPLQFDISNTKSTDSKFIGGSLPSYLTSVYLRLAFTKR